MKLGRREREGRICRPEEWRAEVELRLAERFIDSATRYPQRIAVCQDGEEVSYQDLLNRAAAMSSSIQDRASAGSLVALVLPKGIDMIAAMIATTIAGCGYVPVDPSYPADRIRSCIQDCGPGLVIYAGERPAALDGAGQAISFDGGARAGTDRGVRPGASSDVAYVIYTSGSTGRPKGVMVTHENVLSMFDATVPELGVGADDVWTMFHSPSFDFSVWEMWGALLHGGRLVIVPEAVARSPRDTISLLTRHRVTVFSQTPTAFQAISAAALAGSYDLSALRVIVFGGERLEPAALAPWVSRFGTDTPQLVNMYGITETTVHATLRRITEPDVARVGRSPIGHALGNLTITLVAADGTAVPEGETGEMVLSGPGVTRGYLNRPGLDAERFPILPSGPGGTCVRCYRSGDLAQVSEGELIFLGRNDDQLKIRGYRVEPHEVERALLGCAGVDAAAVVGSSAGAGDDRLVAFVVQSPPADGIDDALAGARDEAAIKNRLAGTLPAYMRPSHVYAIPELPRTPSGKTDRKLLRERATAHLRALTEHDGAGDGGGAAGVRAQVLALGRRTIGIPHLDEDRDVFDQGATSLAVVRLIAEINMTFGIELAPAQLATDSSLAGIAAAAERLAADALVTTA